MDVAAMLETDMDEWQWPASCPELRDMESALRCLICGDFFHGPVLLPCTHTFCSECVRRFLQSRGNHGCCPECKQSCTSRDLVPNRSLEKIGVLFQQMKPKVLPILEKTKALETTTTTTNDNTGKANGDRKPPERMPLLSYSVMKDKDIKKLLDSINIRAQIKNREDIIQIHKEYVLLANAQGDSSHPKSTKQIREEVMANYRARQAEKTLTGSARKAHDAGQTPAMSAEMQAGFKRLRQQVRARSKQQKVNQEQNNGENLSQNEQEDDSERPSETVDMQSGGLWRHLRAEISGQEFYMHSITHEIRVEPPRAFLDHQKRLREHRQRELVAVHGKDTEDNDDDPVVIGTRSAPSSQTEESTQVTKPDDNDDFEILMTSPPPQPPLGSRNTTPQSLSASARKRAERRRSSVGSTSSTASGSVAAFFSQETSCSIQETSTQYVPSASLSLSTQSSSARAENLDETTEFSCSQTQTLSETRWDCPRCTLVNETVGTQPECEACGYKLPGGRPARKKQKLQFQSKLFQSG